MRIAFTTNVCPHYRVATFELLAKYETVDYYFFSAGDEWYAERRNGIRSGDFRYRYLPGISLGRTRYTPTLLWRLWRGNYDVYLKCINGRFALPVAYLAARLRRKPFVLWTGVWMRLKTPFHRIFSPLTKHFYLHADAVVTYGTHVKKYLEAEGVAPERIFVAPHAVDNTACGLPVTEAEKAEVRGRVGADRSKKIILYMGRLERAKGLDYLLDAFATVSCADAILVFVGAGSFRPALEAQVTRLGILQRVRFVGHVAPEDTRSWYAASHMLVLPSVTTPTFKEPWGLVVNEALNQGIPVLATDAVGAAAGGLVQDGYNGFVVPERDSKALANRIQMLLADADLRQRLSANALKTIAAWDNEQMVRGFRQAINYVTRPRGK